MTQDEDTIRHAILSHLSENPGAEDDLQGIAEWWVFESCVRRRVAEVAVVLNGLVDDGLVEVRGGGVARPRYRLADGRLGEVRSAVSADAVEGEGEG